MDEQGWKDYIETLISHNFENLSQRRHTSHGTNKHIPYGTAGFRGHAEDIKPMLFSIGCLVGLKCLGMSSNFGIMVTASHNPPEDNGVKIINSDGGMLPSEWEALFEQVANFTWFDSMEATADLKDKLLNSILDHLTKLSTSAGSWQKIPTGSQVFIGRDTRSSSEEFVRLIKEGLDVWTTHKHGLKYKDFGVTTTPELHYLVAQSTLTQKENIVPSDYHNMLVRGFVSLNQTMTETKKFYDPSALVIDCANGVGRNTLERLAEDNQFRHYLPFRLINTSSESDDILNHECGADFVKTKQLPPKRANQLNKRYSSLDGDADRVVYFYLEQQPEPAGDAIQLRLKLLDGDKILALYVKYLKEMMAKHKLSDSLSLGVVQTAYANGASTEYLRNELHVQDIDCVPTGVKNLHRRARKYDFGVYFEANGHGTILVSEKAKSKIEADAIKDLQLFLGVLNSYTGDAISDILIAETILKHYDWDVKQWYELYQDRPSSLIKVEVKDRSAVSTTDAERKCLKPEGLQAFIDDLVARFGPGARSFVRPSGTEDVVRVYAEAADQESANELSRLVGEKVVELCN